MQIIDSYAKMLGPMDHTIGFTKEDGVLFLKSVEYFARISHRSEDAITDDSYDKILRSVLLKRGDYSVIEHRSVTVEMVVDRGITHEIVRHRLASYTQESTRFVNLKKKGGEAKFIMPAGLTDEQKVVWIRGAEQSESCYMELLDLGCAPQIARDKLETDLAAKIIMTCNLRNWRYFLLARSTMESHPKLRKVIIPLLEEFKQKIPIIFEDIIPEQHQATAFTSMR